MASPANTSSMTTDYHSSAAPSAQECWSRLTRWCSQPLFRSTLAAASSSDSRLTTVLAQRDVRHVRADACLALLAEFVDNQRQPLDRASKMMCALCLTQSLLLHMTQLSEDVQPLLQRIAKGALLYVSGYDNESGSYTMQKVCSALCDALTPSSDLSGSQTDAWLCAVVPLLLQPLVTEWCGLEVQRTVLVPLNSFLERLDRACRSQILHRSSQQLQLVAKLLSTCGDYDVQASLVECLMRLSSRVDRHRMVQLWFADSVTVQRLFLAISNFDADCRIMLNVLNSEQGATRRVHSFPALSVQVGLVRLQKPRDNAYTELWVDVNEGSSKVLVYCDDCWGLDGGTDQWSALSLGGGDIERVRLHLESQRQIVTLVMTSTWLQLLREARPKIDTRVVTMTFRKSFDLHSVLNRVFVTKYRFDSNRNGNSECSKSSVCEFPVRMVSSVCSAQTRSTNKVSVSLETVRPMGRPSSSVDQAPPVDKPAPLAHCSQTSSRSVISGTQQSAERQPLTSAPTSTVSADHTRRSTAQSVIALQPTDRSNDQQPQVVAPPHSDTRHDVSDGELVSVSRFRNSSNDSTLVAHSNHEEVDASLALAEECHNTSNVLEREEEIVGTTNTEFPENNFAVQCDKIVDVVHSPHVPLCEQSEPQVSSTKDVPSLVEESMKDQVSVDFNETRDGNNNSNLSPKPLDKSNFSSVVPRKRSLYSFSETIMELDSDEVGADFVTPKPGSFYTNMLQQSGLYSRGRGAKNRGSYHGPRRGSHQKTSRGGTRTLPTLPQAPSEQRPRRRAAIAALSSFRESSGSSNTDKSSPYSPPLAKRPATCREKVADASVSAVVNKRAPSSKSLTRQRHRLKVLADKEPATPPERPASPVGPGGAADSPLPLHRWSLSSAENDDSTPVAPPYSGLFDDIGATQVRPPLHTYSRRTVRNRSLLMSGGLGWQRRGGGGDSRARRTASSSCRRWVERVQVPVASQVEVMRGGGAGSSDDSLASVPAAAAAAPAHARSTSSGELGELLVEPEASTGVPVATLSDRTVSGFASRPLTVTTSAAQSNPLSNTALFVSAVESVPPAPSPPNSAQSPVQSPLRSTDTHTDKHNGKASALCDVITSRGDVTSSTAVYNNANKVSQSGSECQSDNSYHIAHTTCVDINNNSTSKVSSVAGCVETVTAPRHSVSFNAGGLVPPSHTAVVEATRSAATSSQARPDWRLLVGRAMTALKDDLARLINSRIDCVYRELGVSPPHH